MLSLIQRLARPSSELEIALCCKNRLFSGKRRQLGVHSGKIVKFIENGEWTHSQWFRFPTVFWAENALPLFDVSGKDLGERVEFTLTLDTKMRERNIVAQRVDQAVDASQTIGSSETPLGRAINSMEHIVAIVGAAAEACY